MINLVIATYAGYTQKFSLNKFKDKYLKYNLFLLNKIQTNIDQITIMRPAINKEHLEMKDYYNFEGIDIDNIKHKIKIYDCENIGISYGQFITAIEKDPCFDYYIFLEDDYFVFKDNFEQDFIKNMEKDNRCNRFLCLFKRNDVLWNLIHEMNTEPDDVKKVFIEKTKNYYELSGRSPCPDFSIGILHQSGVKNLLQKFTNFTNIMEIFNINFKCIWHHQMLFGFILTMSGIEIVDINDKFLNVFYETKINAFEIKNSTLVNLPLFVPVDIFFYSLQYVEKRKDNVPDNFHPNLESLMQYIKNKNILSTNDYIQFKYKLEWLSFEIYNLKI